MGLFDTVKNIGKKALQFNPVTAPFFAAREVDALRKIQDKAVPIIAGAAFGPGGAVVADVGLDAIDAGLGFGQDGQAQPQTDTSPLAQLESRILNQAQVSGREIGSQVGQSLAARGIQGDIAPGIVAANQTRLQENAQDKIAELRFRQQQADAAREFQQGQADRQFNAALFSGATELALGIIGDEELRDVFANLGVNVGELFGLGSGFGAEPSEPVDSLGLERQSRLA